MDNYICSFLMSKSFYLIQVMKHAKFWTQVFLMLVSLSTDAAENMEIKSRDHMLFFYVRRIIWRSIMATFSSVLIWFLVKFQIKEFRHSTNQHVDVINVAMSLIFLLILVVLCIFLIILIILDCRKIVKQLVSGWELRLQRVPWQKKTIKLKC